MGEGFYISDRETEFKLIGAVNGTQVRPNMLIFYLIFILLKNNDINFQVFHTCEKCRMPIMFYGRMIPCKVCIYNTFWCYGSL